jgi:FAD-dependent oxidoreductase family protein
LVEELGEGTVELMKTIKRAIDPLGIMNPGKVGAIRRGLRCCLTDGPQQLYPDDDDVSDP